MTATATDRDARRAPLDDGRSGFGGLVLAEWTKFRSVRSWWVWLVVGALVMVLFSVLTGIGSRSTYGGGPDGEEQVGHPYVPTGPGGEPVTDQFYFVHQQLDGDGSLTARVSDLVGRRLSPDANAGTEGSPSAAEVNPWAKAGLMVKADLAQGSSYAAVMTTGGHGVRMQYDFTGDIGPAEDVSPPVDPQWLRLTRAGSTVTAEASTDGTTWTTVGSVTVPALASSVEIGMFVTTPATGVVTQHLGGGGSVTGGGAVATATFDSVALQGNRDGSEWTGSAVGTGDDTRTADLVGVSESAGSFTISGSGDIAPATGGVGTAPERVLIGAFGPTLVVMVLAVLFITTEYRRGLIRTTLSASPRRGRVLAAKALVIGAAGFVVTLVAAAVALPVGEWLLAANGNYVFPISGATRLRLIVGSGAVAAGCGVLALAIGTIVRRSAAAIATVTTLMLLPFVLATAAVLPAGPSDWLLTVTPAAAFAMHQTAVAYPQVDGAYTPAFGYFPLGPWAGFAVLCGYAAVATVVAVVLLRRRDV